MAVRRPRIKASANLMSSKRKTKAEVDIIGSIEKQIDTGNQEKLTKREELNKKLPVKNNRTSKKKKGNNLKTNNSIDAAHPLQLIEIGENGDKSSKSTYNEEQQITPESQGTKFHDPNAEKLLQDPKNVDTDDHMSFKYPPNVSYNRSNSHVGNHSTSGASTDEVFSSDIEENVIQMDLMKSINSACPVSPVSPSKIVSRQRIRATPIFGQRRNSLVNMCQSPYASDESGADFSAITTYRRERHYSASISQGSNPNTTHRRERHYSASLSQGSNSHHHMPHKYVASKGRFRTESCCSTFSDSYAGSTKSRKTDDHHHNNRNLSRHDFEARFNKGVVPDKSLLKMFDLIYYNPVTNPMEQKSNKANINDEKSNGEASKAFASHGYKINTKEGTDRPAVVPVPQLKLNAKGELILDDKSLEIETTAEQEARKVLASSSLIFLDENTGMNGFYKKQKRTREWPPEETIKFYRCLQTIGTDFSLMGQLFSNRTRRDLKLKFKKEERCNLALINKALLYPKIFNIDELKQQLDVEERERAEANRKWKEIKAQEAKNVKIKMTSNPNKSAAARALEDGDIVYKNENVTKRKIRRMKYRKSRRSNPSSRISEKDGSHDSVQETVEPLKKKKRKRRELKRKIVITSDSIKYENIKYENNTHHPSVVIKGSEEIDNSQLENEIADLLQQNNQSVKGFFKKTKNNCLLNNAIPIAEKINEGLEDIKDLLSLDNGTVINEKPDVPYISLLENGAENVVVFMEEEEPQLARESDVNESDIEQILTELAEGSMVLLSTLDPNNVDSVLNEIYMFDKNTGDLCEEPLDIPDAIVQSILIVMS